MVRSAGGHQGYLRKIGDPTGGAEVPRRCGRPVRFRAGISQCQGRSGSPGRSLYRYGECPEWGICGYGAEAFYEAGDPQRPQIRSAARCCVVRRLLRICSPRSVRDDPFAVLFSTECSGSRTVRAYPDHCGRGCIPAFYRRLFRPKVQRGKPPCRLCGAVRGEKCKTALLHHRELVQEYVQSEYQAGVGGRRRYHRMGIRFLRIPRILSVPHERAER